MSLTADDIVALIAPVKKMASENAWRAALARLCGDAAVPVDEDAERISRSLTVPQYAGRMGVADRTVWNWVRDRKVVSFKTHGGRRFIDPTENGLS